MFPAEFVSKCDNRTFNSFSRKVALFSFSVLQYCSYRLVHLKPGIYLNNVLKIHLLLNKKHSVSIMKDRPGDAVSEIVAVWYVKSYEVHRYAIGIS